MLATSREALDIEGEHVYRVAPLAVDEHGTGPAAELFVQRARAAGRNVGAADPAVARIVRRLDGMPLAIELAAARSATSGTMPTVEACARCAAPNASFT